MPSGTPVNRHWVIVLKDGAVAIDWGDGIFQDVRSGEFLQCSERDVSHHIMDKELDWLKHIGRVDCYDSKEVYFYSLPERPQSTLD